MEADSVVVEEGDEVQVWPFGVGMITSVGNGKVRGVLPFEKRYGFLDLVFEVDATKMRHSRYHTLAAEIENSDVTFIDAPKEA